MTANLVPAQLPHMSISKRVTSPYVDPNAPDQKSFIVDLTNTGQGSGDIHGWTYNYDPVGLGKELDWFPISSSDPRTPGVIGYGPGITAKGVPGLWSMRITISTISGSFSDEYMSLSASWGDNGYSDLSLGMGLVWSEMPISKYNVQLLTKPAVPFSWQLSNNYYLNPQDVDVVVTTRIDIQQLVPNVAITASDPTPNPVDLSASTRNTAVHFGT